MNYVQLLEKVKEELTFFFHTQEKPALLYHNSSHTQQVVANAGMIARHYQLNDHDYFVVITAAWFHDAGYYMTNSENHEKAGAEMAAEFLRTHEVDEATIDEVSNCIMATKMPQSPKNLNEEILCDADLFHLGTNDFGEFNRLLRKEMSMRTGSKISKAEWWKKTIQLMETHQFKTDYVRKLLDKKKKQHLSELREKQKNDQASEKAPVEEAKTSQPPSATTTAAPERRPKAAKDERPNRGIETMFRISSANHQRLSDMADNKAHIMITTTSIILSVLLSLLLRRLEDYPNLVIPTMLLLIVCVVTMVFAILSTRPSLPKGTFSRQDIDDKNVNLLFFGNFYRMSLDEYSGGMQKMMNDREFLYGSLIRDVYSQGRVLGRKYRLLRIAYNIFMYGIVVAVFAFVFAVTY